MDLQMGEGVVVHTSHLCQWWIIGIVRVGSVDLQMGEGLWFRHHICVSVVDHRNR